MTEVEHGILWLAYKKNGGGVWVARRYLGDKRYQLKTIGTADDALPANGDQVLDYRQAVRAARAWFSSASAPIEVTVAAVLDRYFIGLAKKGQDTRSAEAKAKHSILPQLGDVKLADLTSTRIDAWLTGLANRPRRVHGATSSEKF